MLELPVRQQGFARFVDGEKSDVHGVDERVEQEFPAGARLQQHLQLAILLLHHRLLGHHARRHHPDGDADGEHDEGQEERLRQRRRTDCHLRHEHGNPDHRECREESGGEGGAGVEAGRRQPDDGEHREQPDTCDDRAGPVPHQPDGKKIEQRNDQEAGVGQPVPGNGEAEEQQKGLQCHTQDEHGVVEDLRMEDQAADDNQEHGGGERQLGEHNTAAEGELMELAKVQRQVGKRFVHNSGKSPVGR